MKILFAGIIARYPFGGVTWCSLMYLLGLRALGHEVFYIEDTGECVYDPDQDAISTDPSYGTRYIHAALDRFGLGDRWSFVNYDGVHHGAAHEVVKAYCADADLFVNLSGGSWFWRDEYLRNSAARLRGLGSGVYAAGDCQRRGLVCGLLPHVRPSLYVRGQHRNAGLRRADRRVRLAQDLATCRHRVVAHAGSAHQEIDSRQS